MKKLSLILVGCLMVACLCFAAGCGNSKATEKDIVGVWEVTEVSEDGKSSPDSLEFVKAFIQFTFTEDKACTYSPFVSSENEIGKWTLADNKVTMTFYDQTVEATYDGGKLKCTFDESGLVLKKTDKKPSITVLE